MSAQPPPSRLVIASRVPDHLESAAAARAERQMSRLLRGNSDVPLVAYARLRGGMLECTALIASSDGAQLLRALEHGAIEHPEQLRTRVAEQLLTHGVGRLIEI